MRILRVGVTVPLGLVLAWLLLGWGGDLLGRGPSRVEDVVALGAAATGGAVALWYSLTALALLLAELATLSRRTTRVARGLRAAVGRLGAPVLRRAAVVGVGAGLALSAVPAGAGPPVPFGDVAPVAPSSAGDDAVPAGADPPVPFGAVTPVAPSSADDDAVPLDLRPGLSPIDEPSGAPPTEEASPPSLDQATSAPPAEVDAAASPSPPPGAAHAQETPDNPSARPGHGSGVPPQAADRRSAAPAAEGTTAGAHGRAGSSGTGTATSAAARTDAPYVVRRGDSLWAIAGAHLGASATAADIAAEWPRWYETNRAVVGADPDLIHPGQELLAPDSKDTP